ncbi:NAD-dependent epimerase/dehydratase family protein [Chloroflexus sp.]|uniref:NAD-dependent epimerase/dehydratase family protein n=1 Tax=Chloroflexus sp. TaxID=1904827 RepID=UPI00298F01AC|nr:NAD-dependent epimerase/dehydratase family protein [Chloroflexus sp.]MCS6887800.1 NAD-dependent epimerase/dehydratase family protein [Chloroflexus sp.]MDW8404977.1 NAD-dependent epimerase/dehydratase family protein [Chloroflexus sp.]
MADRVLITGGAGFLGINLARYLLARGYIVRSLDIAPFDYPERSQIEEHTGDIRDRAAVDRAMQGVKFVVHTAAALPLYSPADIFSTDIDGTRNVLESARDHGVERVVHISSTAVYGIPDHHPLLETDPLSGVGPYGEAKVKAEELCLEFRKAGMCVPILRPKSFVGPERLGIFAMLYDWAMEGHNFPLPGNGKNRYQLLDVEDLCEAIVRCLTLDRDRVNDTFNIGAKEFTTIKEDFQAVLDAAGHGKKIITFPAAPMVWALAILEKLKLSPVYKWAYGTVTEDSFVSVEKAERVLGFTPKYSNKEALVRNYQWYVANAKKFGQQTGVSHRVPWSQGILRLAKLFF